MNGAMRMLPIDVGRTRLDVASMRVAHQAAELAEKRILDRIGKDKTSV